MYVTKLSDESKRILSVIVDKGVATGSDLQWATEMNPDQLVAALEPLLQLGLVGASGNPSTPKGVLESFFNLKPSARNLVDYYLGGLPA